MVSPSNRFLLEHFDLWSLCKCRVSICQLPPPAHFTFTYPNAITQRQSFTGVYFLLEECAEPSIVAIGRIESRLRIAGMIHMLHTVTPAVQSV